MQLKIPPGGGFGRKFLIYFWRGGGGGPGNLETPLSTPLSIGYNIGLSSSPGNHVQ